MNALKILRDLIKKAYDDRTVDGVHPETEYSQGFIDGLEWARDKIKEGQPQLDENQLFVLHWLRNKYELLDFEPIELIWRLKVNSRKSEYKDHPCYKAYRTLDKKEQAQVLEELGRWVLEQEIGADE